MPRSLCRTLRDISRGFSPAYNDDCTVEDESVVSEQSKYDYPCHTGNMFSRSMIQKRESGQSRLLKSPQQQALVESQPRSWLGFFTMHQCFGTGFLAASCVTPFHPKHTQYVLNQVNLQAKGLHKSFMFV